MGLMAVGIGMMAVSAVVKAKGIRDQATIQAGVAGFNARVMRQQRDDAMVRGALAEQRQRKATGQLAGHQRALIGGSGAAVGEGATARIIEDTLAEGELDALMERNNASREAWGYETQALQFDFARSVAKKQKRSAVMASLLGSAASITTQSMLASRQTGGK